MSTPPVPPRRPSCVRVGMDTPIDEKETLDAFGGDDISPISSGLLHGGGGDVEGQEGASRHLSDGAPPPWAQDLQHSLLRLDKGQQDTLEQLHVTHQTLRDKMQTLESRQDAHLEGTQAFEARLSALETEVRDLRSRSPSVASGSVSLRNLRFEAKRESIEDEVRAWFERAECLPLQDLHIGGVRANSCRVDLRYMQNNMRERRQVQNLCIEALRAAARASEIPGQQGGKLWAGAPKNEQGFGP